MITGITGVILAGGKSTRMGTDKALLPFRGQPLIEFVLQTLKGIFSRVVVSVRERGAFPNIASPKVVDRYKETGPMGGIASVLESGETRIFCAGCDMPFLSRALIEYLCSLSEEVVIPVWEGKTQALHAIYSASLLSSFQSALSQGKYRITDAISPERVRYVSEDEITRFDPGGVSFKNLNTPADYRDMEKL